MIGSNKVLMAAAAGLAANQATAWEIPTWNKSSVAVNESAIWSNTEASGILYHGVFSDSGNKFYGLNNSAVSRYDLSVAYNLNTATIAQNRVINTGGYGIFVSPDGTKVFATNRYSNYVREWTLATPHNLSTATVTYTLNTPYFGRTDALTMSADGTKLVVGGDAGGDFTTSYTLSTPWVLSSATWDIPQFNSVASNGIGCIRFNSDGTRLIGLANSSTLRSFDLSTAYTIPDSLNTANPTVSKPTGATAYNFCFSGDGLTLFTIGNSSTVNSYTLTVPYDISTFTGTIVETFSLNSIFVGANAIRGIHVSADGLTLLVVDASTRYVYKGTFGTANSVTTLTDSGQKYLTSYGFYLTVSPDGKEILVGTEYYGSYRGYRLSTPYDLTTVTSSYTVNPQRGSYSRGAEWSGDGYVLYLSSDTAVYKTNVSTPYLAQGATWLVPASGYIANLIDWGLVFNDTGTILYSVDDTYVRKWNLSTPFNISSYSGVVTVTWKWPENARRNLVFNADGTTAWTYGQAYGIYGYVPLTLSTPYDLQTATEPMVFQGVLPIAPISGSGVSGISFADSGLKMVVAIEDNQYHYVFNLSSPYDVSTASLWYSDTRGVSAIKWAGFNLTGTVFYLIERSTNAIRFYNLSTPYDTRVVTSSGLKTFDFDGYRDWENFCFHSDGLGIFGASPSRDYLTSSELPVVYDVNSYAGVFTRLYTAPTTSNLDKVALSEDGTILLGLDGSTLHQWRMSSPNDISTVSYVGSRAISSLTNSGTIYGFATNATGTKLYLGRVNSVQQIDVV